MARQHPLFVKNQVLTEQHLNTLFQFLNDEGRFTRERLLGQGIVRGLDVSSDLRTRVVVGQGWGVTSSGEIVWMEAEATTYTHHRRYAVVDRYFTERGVQQAWELLEGSAPGATPISREPGSLESKIAVLCLDVRDRSRSACGGTDCNERGRYRELTQRLLLVAREEAARLVLPEGTFFAPPVPPEAVRPYRPRFLEQASSPGTLRYRDVVNAFDESLRAVEASLGKALDETIRGLPSFLGAAAPEPRAAEKLRQVLDAARRDPRAFQYAFGWVRDLTAAYAELLELVSRMGGRSCPASSFSSHLLLGALEDDLREGYRPPRVPRPPSPYRFPFLPSPLVGNQADLRDEAASLLQRLVLQLEGFSRPSSDRIRIVPDAGPRAPLSQRTIPGYYGGGPGGAGALPDQWSYPRARAGWSRGLVEIDPLRQDHQGAAFFRVEGHIEQPVERALAAIEEQRRSLGLPFNVVAVTFDEDVKDMLPSRDFRPADLMVAYDELREEIRCKLDAERRFFATWLGDTPEKLQLVDLTVDWASAGKPNMDKEVGPGARIHLLLRHILNMLPGDLATLNLDQLKGYLLMLKDAARSLESATMSSAASLSASQAQLLQHLQDLTSQAYLEAISLLRHTFDERQRQEKRRLMFREFLSEHPSLEHLGGVPRGGTFVIGYEAGVVKADFALSYLCCDPRGPLLLQVPDAQPPPKEILVELSEVKPTRTVVIPEVKDDVVLRAIVEDPERLATIREDQIQIAGRPSIFQLSEYTIEYLIQNRKSGRTAVGRISLTLIPARPLETPGLLEYPAQGPTMPVSIPMATLVPGGLPSYVDVTGARMEDPKLGSASVESGKTIVFQPAPEAFLQAGRASITYALHHTYTDQTVTGTLVVLLKQAFGLKAIAVSLHLERPENLVAIEVPLSGKEGLVVEAGRMDPSYCGEFWVEEANHAIVFKPDPRIFGRAVSKAIITYYVKERAGGDSAVGLVSISGHSQERTVEIASLTDEMPILLPDRPESMAIAGARLKGGGPVGVTEDGKSLVFQPPEWFAKEKRADIFYTLRGSDGFEIVEGKVAVRLELPAVKIPRLTVRVDARESFLRLIGLPLPAGVIARYPEPASSAHGNISIAPDERQIQYRPAPGAPPGPLEVRYVARETRTGVEEDAFLSIVHSPAIADPEVTVPSAKEEVSLPLQGLPPGAEVIVPSDHLLGEVKLAGETAIHFLPNESFEKAGRAEIVYTVRDVERHEQYERRATIRVDASYRHELTAHIYTERRLPGPREIDLMLPEKTVAVAPEPATSAHGNISLVKDKRRIRFRPSAKPPPEPLEVTFEVRNTETGARGEGKLRIVKASMEESPPALVPDKECNLVLDLPADQKVAGIVYVSSGEAEIDKEGKDILFKPDENFRREGSAEIIYLIQNLALRELRERQLTVHLKKGKTPPPAG